ncbi:olfactory receptor 52J3-like [Scleropages formosus]|uniref:olfactory receptor 52J3-like n=1 Tax=Scleropages formosus TaxID=113540 RepID=UPI0010FA7CB3|nr:olfactory receptor 52J3-like [Scleropages formosus]
MPLGAIVGLARSLSYCQSNEIKHYFCEHMALVTLACRIKNDMSSNSHMAISTMYLLVPTCLNPIIYGIRTKEIRQQVIKAIGSKCGQMST